MYIYNVYMCYAYILYIYYISMLYITRPAKCRGAPWPVDCCEARISVVPNLCFLAILAGVAKRRGAPLPAARRDESIPAWARHGDGPLSWMVRLSARGPYKPENGTMAQYIYNIQSICNICNIYEM